MVKDAFTHFASSYDPEYGGFGRAPKFPSPHNLILLLRYSKIYDDQNALKMVDTTLHYMRLGGMFDQIGLGFTAIQQISVGFCLILRKCFMTRQCSLLRI